MIKRKRRTDNTMIKRKREGQRKQSSKEKEKAFSFSFNHCIVCPSLFLLIIVLSVLLFFF
jgi:hypothetical protein